MVAQTADDVMVGLGPVSTGEKKVALLMLSTIVVWATETWHGIDTDLVGIMAGITVLLPGVGVLQAKDAFRKIGWDTVIFVAAALSFGEVTGKTAVSGLLVATMAVILNAGHSEISFLMMLLVVGFLGRLLLRSGAANAAVLLIPAVQLAKGLGYNAALVGMVFPLCVAGIFIYQHAFGLVAYDYGTFEEPDFILACLVRYVALAAAIAVGYYLWWPLLAPL
jgi:di/tricarboxylate transporter